MMLIDTHQVVEDIIKSGLKKNQAEIITRAINQSNNNLVTKYDLKCSTEKLELKIDSVKVEIDSVRSEVSSVRSEVGTLKWLIGLLFALNITIIGLVLNITMSIG